METATTIAAFAGLILAIINLIWLISGNFIKTFVSFLKLIKETSENEEKIFKSMDMPIATGDQLNQLAYLHGLERNKNETDEELRIRIMSVRKKMGKKNKKYLKNYWQFNIKALYYNHNENDSSQGVKLWTRQ